MSRKQAMAIDIEKAREHFLLSQYILNDLDKDGKSNVIPEAEVNRKLKIIYEEWSRLEQQYMDYSLQVLQHQSRISTANSSPSHSLRNHFPQHHSLLIDNVYILSLPVDFKYSYVTDGKLYKGSLRIRQSLCVYQVFTRLTTRMTYLHLYGITSERSIYLCINRDRFEKGTDLEVAALFFEPSPIPPSIKENPFSDLDPDGFSISNVPILTGMSEIGDGTIVYEEPQGYDSLLAVDTTRYGSYHFDGSELLYRTFSKENKTMVVVREIATTERKLMREITTEGRKLFFTVNRPYFEEEEDMTTAHQLLQSIQSRTITVRPAVGEEEVQRILDGYAPPQESPLRSPQVEVESFLEMYSTSGTASQRLVISDSINAEEHGFSPRRTNDQSRLQTSATLLPTKTVSVTTQTPPLPADNKTTFHTIEQQQYQQQYQQPQQQQQQPPPQQQQLPAPSGETKSSSSAIGIQDIIDIKNEIANIKRELSAVISRENQSNLPSQGHQGTPGTRTPTVIRLEAKIERLELLLIEYLRTKNNEDDAIHNLHNLTVTGSAIPSTIAGTTPSSSHQKNRSHPVPRGTSPLSSETTPAAKSIWLTNQRPTATQYAPYQPTESEQPVRVEDLWDLLDLAEQLTHQS